MKKDIDKESPLPIDARLYLAAAALQGLCACAGARLTQTENAATVAECCLRLADAMLAALDEKDRSAAT